MLLILLATVLVLGIAFFQVVQGLYSSLVMTILSVICAMLAINFYEPVAALLYEYQPGHADAITLIVLFVVPLLVLRILSDKYLSANIVIGVWPSRIGGGALGLLTALIVVGMLTLSIQMLPWGPSIMGYRPFNDSLQRDQKMGPFRPDEFVLGMAKFLSAGSLGTGQNWTPDNDATPKHTFANTHDDLLLELFRAHNQILREAKDDEGKVVEFYSGRVDAAPNSITPVTVYEPGELSAFDELPRGLLKKNTPSKVIIISTSVNQTAQDEDGWWRLPATHFLLLTVDKQAKTKSYYPVAFLQDGAVSYGPTAGEDAVPPPPGKIFLEADSKTSPILQTAWIYKVPLDSQAVRLIFRRIASQKCPRPVAGMP